MTYLGVCGWPVAHSRSPPMHNAGARGRRASPTGATCALPLPPELFAETVRALPAAGFRGVNVTIPHKEAALALADDATEAARAIGAANTLTFEDGAIHADNTDAPALLELAARRARPRRAARARARRGRRARAPRCGRCVQAGAPRSRSGTGRPARAAGARRRRSARAPSRIPEHADIVVNCTSVGLSTPT